MKSGDPVRMDEFRYLLRDSSTVLRFQLSGALSGEAVRSLEQTWQTASSVIGTRPLVVDLTNLTGIDTAGRALLERLEREGARIVAASSSAKEWIESETGCSVMLDSNQNPSARRSYWRAPRWVLALLSSLLLGGEVR